MRFQPVTKSLAVTGLPSLQLLLRSLKV